MRKIATFATIMTLSFGALSASEMDGKQLFEANCASCHAMQMPEDRSKMTAPLAKAVVFHLSEAFKSKEKMKKHIEEFVPNPSEDKAICRSIKRFGLMPSLKGAVSEEDLKKISDWMVENLSMTNEEHEAMQKANHKGKHGRGSQGQGMHRGGGKHQGKGNCQKG